jgi:alanine-synthesizing transaminase
MFSDRTGWNLQPSQLSKALADYRVSGNPLIDLTESNPTKCGFRYNRQHILGALSNPRSLTYDPVPQGLLNARNAVADYYRSHQCAVNAGDIFLTTSTSEAYSFVLRALCNPGDEVLIPQPGYPLLNFLADLHDVTLVRYPLLYDYGWQIDFAALHRLITPRTRAVVVVNPNNPTGHFCKTEEMARFNEICSQHQMAIIADEVFLDFSFGGEIPKSLASNDQVLTFAMSGLSKISGLPQMKAAWLVASGPESLKRESFARLEMIADTYLSMNTPAQLALPLWLDERHPFRQQWLERAQRNLAKLDELLSGQKLCTRLKLEGGWYAILKIPRLGSDDDFALELLTSRGVYVHPGHFYDFPPDGYLVVSLITPESEFGRGVHVLLAMVGGKNVDGLTIKVLF